MVGEDTYNFGTRSIDSLEEPNWSKGIPVPEVMLVAKRNPRLVSNVSTSAPSSIFNSLNKLPYIFETYNINSGYISSEEDEEYPSSL